MSFAPLNNTSDYDVYTTKYLQNLALQIQLNQNNFDKNVAYMKTGVQDTERSDSRSIEERAGDVEKLKVQARVMLNKITDATNTNEVLNYLVNNGELLFFFIQQFPAIEKVVKEQYVGGVRAPILISLIYKRFISQQEDSLMPESADFDIVSNLMTRQDAEILANQTKNPELKRELNDLVSVLPSQEEIKRLIDNPAGNKDEIKFVAEMFKNSPNVKDYNRLTEEYNDAPLKDESTNYDLEQAEDMMKEIINSFLVERQLFQDDRYNQKTMRQIDRTNAKRVTKPLPVAKDTRIAPTSEQQRKITKGRRQTIEDIKEGQYTLYPSTTNVSELSPAEQLKLEREAMNRSKMIKDISEPRPIFSNTELLKPTRTRKSKKTLAERVRQEEEQQAIEEEQQAIEDFVNRTQAQRNPITLKYRRQPTQKDIDAQMEEETQRFEMRKMGKSDTKASERQQEAKQKEDRELQRIINEMEQLKRDKKKKEEEQKAKDEKYNITQQILKNQAGSKISTFVKKQQALKTEKQLSKLEDNPNEPEKIDEYNQRVKRRPGRPVGSRDKNPRSRTSSEQMSLARRLEALQQPIYPETPTEIEEKALARRLEELQQPTLPKAPTTTPKKKIKVLSTGTGLLNQQEQLSHRFKVLKGEILAGNTASQVVKEMKSLVKKLVKSGELSIEQHDGILKELKTL